MKPKSLSMELFTNVKDFDIEFLNGATTNQKGILMGAILLLDAISFQRKFYESTDKESADE